jgi:hypothetical protein
MNFVSSGKSLEPLTLGLSGQRSVLNQTGISRLNGTDTHDGLRQSVSVQKGCFTIESSEILARYATQSGHFRPSDRTAKPEMFMPHPHRDLSVTRHLEATECQIDLIAGKFGTWLTQIDFKSGFSRGAKIRRGLNQTTVTQGFGRGAKVQWW